MPFSAPMLDEHAGGDEPQHFGHWLRARRETRGLTIDDVAHATNIGPEIIEAIEAGTVLEHTPPAYARGFVRTYAEHLEADLDRVMEAFDRLRPREPARLYVKGVGTMTHKDFRPRRHRHRPSRLRIVAIVLLAIFLCILAVYVYVHIDDWLGLSPKPAAEPGDTPSADAETARADIGPPPAADMPFVLRVHADENAYIKARVDGKLVYNQVLGKGATNNWKGRTSVRLELADPSAVRVTRDGKPITEALGTEPVVIILDENGLQVSALNEP